jgi:hypothetical protein
MWGSAAYGLFMGVAFVLLGEVAPQPVGSIVLWGALAGQLTWGTGVCWRRTGLPFATAAMAIGAATAGLLTVLAASGNVFPDLPLGWWVPVGFGLFSGPACLFVESRIHRAEWKRWRDYMEPKNAWDIFTGRHIPNLRSEAK